MKKKFIYLCAVICSMSLFTACSDDDDKQNLPDSQTTFTTEGGLLLTVNGDPMVGKVATFTPAQGSAPATITLSGEPLDIAALIGGGKADQGMDAVMTSGVIPGSPEVTIPVDIKNGEFSGSFDADYCTFKYAGDLTKSTLQLTLSDVELKNKTLSNTAWTVSTIERDDWVDTISGVADPLRLVWETDQDFQLEIMPGFSMPMPISTIIGIAAQMPLIPISATETVGVQTALPMLLQQVTFAADGNIRAKYVDIANGATAPVESPVNLAQYVVKDANTILVFLNIQNIIYVTEQNAHAAGDTDFDMSAVMQLVSAYLPYLQKGIPLEYTMLDSETMSVYLNNAFLQPIVLAGANMLKSPEIQEMIKNAIAGSEDMKDYADMLSALLPQAPDVLGSTTKIELGLNLTKQK